MTYVLLALVAFGLGWSAHRRRTYWAKVHVTGVLEQWIEERCGHLLGIKSMAELDAIMDEILRRQRMPPLLRRWRRSRKRPERASAPAVDPDDDGFDLLRLLVGGSMGFTAQHAKLLDRLLREHHALKGLP